MLFSPINGGDDMRKNRNEMMWERRRIIILSREENKEVSNLVNYEGNEMSRTSKIKLLIWIFCVENF